MSDKIYLGSRVSELEIGQPSLPVSKVILNVDSENSYVAGDDSGLTIEQYCPWATQAMANSVLAKLKDFVYNSYSGIDALLDPAAEIGDAITVGGSYGILAQIGRSLDRLGAATIGAPGVDEIEDEYPYKPKQRKEADRLLSKAYSRISKTAEEIILEVNGIGESVTTLSVTLEGVTITDTTGITRIKGSSIDVSTLNVNDINLSGRIAWNDLNNTAQFIINTASSAASSAATNLELLANGQYKGGTFIDGTNLYSPNLYGDTINLMDGNSRLVGTMSMQYSKTYAFDIDSKLSLRMQAASGYNAYVGTNGGPFLLLGGGICQLGGGALCVTGESFGPSLPFTGNYGQVFFLLA